MKMNRFAFLLALTAGVLAAAEPARHPVLLELFTSEGCSSCPPADRLLEMLDSTQPVAGADLIVLSEHVDYWNQFGWKDPFSSAEFSERQQRYSAQLGIENIYTPQLVIDGTRQLVGNDKSGVRAAIEKQVGEEKLPLSLSTPVRDGDRLDIRVDLPAGRAQATLYIVLAENRTQSQVLRGENTGRSLSHVGVVRKLIKVGSVKRATAFSQEVQIPVPPGVGANGIRIVAFVQDSRGRVLAATQQKL